MYKTKKVNCRLLYARIEREKESFIQKIYINNMYTLQIVQLFILTLVDDRFTQSGTNRIDQKGMKERRTLWSIFAY